MARRIIKQVIIPDAVLESQRDFIEEGIRCWALARTAMDEQLKTIVENLPNASPGSEDVYFQRLVKMALERGGMNNVFLDTKKNRIKVDGKEIVVKVLMSGKNRSDSGSSRAVMENDHEAVMHVHFFCADNASMWDIQDKRSYSRWQLVTRWIDMDDFCAGQHRFGNHSIESHTNHRPTTKWILGAPATKQNSNRHVFENLFYKEQA